MADFDQMAYDAIEAQAVEEFPDFAGGQWVTAVPTDDPDEGLGYQAGRWRADGRTIVNRFNRSLKPLGPVTVTDDDLDIAGSKPLGQFQRFLADLARRAEVQASIKLFRS